MCLYIFKNKHTFNKHSSIHNRTTRFKELFRLPTYRLELSKRAPNYLGLQLFNHLPERIKASPSTGKFKTNLKCMLLEKSFDEYFCAQIT